ncbi:TetR/AcrR family transcriptional regulator [Streptosporangium sp. NPDC004379]|uniref:TetR/AcrR family transcriptional regulator n=1 Tax=Streptosporangium sp. NPDC004379 TaxID=3366189 RepID=UPI0036CD0AA1
MSDELPALPWDRPRGRTRPPRIPLSRDRIIEAAFTVLDREGYDRLSMRMVAAELGVAVSALYAHVSSKDELLELMYARFFADLEWPEPDPERWREQLRDYTRAALARLRSHRDMARVSMGAVPFKPEMLPHMDALLGVFRAAGLPDRVAGAAGDVLSTFVDGFALEENMWQDRYSASDELTWQGMREALERYFAELPPERFPHLTALSHSILGRSNDERFDLGVEIIIRGLASFAAEAAANDEAATAGTGSPERPAAGTPSETPEAPETSEPGETRQR